MSDAPDQRRNDDLATVQERIRCVKRELAALRKREKELMPPRARLKRRAVILLLVLFPIQYLASTGPIVWLESRGYMRPGGLLGECVEIVYAPLIWVFELWPASRLAFDKYYFELWR